MTREQRAKYLCDLVKLEAEGDWLEPSENRMLKRSRLVEVRLLEFALLSDNNPRVDGTDDDVVPPPFDWIAWSESEWVWPADPPKRGRPRKAVVVAP